MDNSRRETIYLRVSRLILVGEVSGEDVWDFILEVDQLGRGVDAVARGVRGVVDLDQHDSVPREEYCWFYVLCSLFYLHVSWLNTFALAFAQFTCRSRRRYSPMPPRSSGHPRWICHLQEKICY